MPDRTTIDSSTLLPLQAPGLDASSRGDAQATPLAAPAKKARRPRPTFDDGALTRIFKFPSKAYPRSSYYVTGTEIIIRIKKARKKWKLIVPKKRVVSYRTNRWFAKPRWVAIELTYTQAVKLGLVEARARALDVAPEIVASNAASPEQSDVAYAEPAAASSRADLEVPGRNVAEHQDDLTDQFDVLDEQDRVDDFQVAANPDEAEAEAEEPLLQHSSLVFHSEVTPPRVTAAMQTDDNEARVVSLGADRRPPVAAPRRTFQRVVTTLAAAFTGLVIWTSLDIAFLTPSRDCAGAEPAPHCANPIVTGSIGPNSARQLPAPAPVADPPLSDAQIAAMVQAELAAQNTATSAPLLVPDEQPDTALSANTPHDARIVVLLDRDIALPLSPPVFASAAPSPQPTATAPAACDSLGAAGRHILINFDYGRSDLDPAVLAVLEKFAAKLRACPASKVTIEGHTDSDGRADRNRTLSLRRAQAVHKHLVAAGVDPDQLATIGFGQARPVVPNVSQQNKRNNRRAALVVTTRR